MKLDAKHCVGCRDDFYNGHNDLGVMECWHRDGAKFDCYKLIPIDLPPPYNSIRTQLLPTCYTKQRYVKVKPELLTRGGYWK